MSAIPRRVIPVGREKHGLAEPDPLFPRQPGIRHLARGAASTRTLGNKPRSKRRWRAVRCPRRRVRYHGTVLPTPTERFVLRSRAFFHFFFGGGKSRRSNSITFELQPPQGTSSECHRMGTSRCLQEHRWLAPQEKARDVPLPARCAWTVLQGRMSGKRILAARGSWHGHQSSPSGQDPGAGARVSIGQYNIDAKIARGFLWTSNLPDRRPSS